MRWFRGGHRERQARRHRLAGRRRQRRGGIGIPSDIADRLKEHGVDVDRRKGGAWQDWDEDKWLSEAEDFVDPVIEGPWNR